VVKDSDIVELVSQKTKIPVAAAVGEEAESLLALEDKIHRRLIDQEEAVKAVASAIRQYRAGMSRAKGPIASFLFIGPTGVGKTELAKSLAEIYFGSEEAMVRFDMSEYQAKSSIFRFIGSPETEGGGTLTEAVKNNPYSLVLLDEFEKAHPDVLNLFLAVFDDGRLTDNLGNVVDFTNAIIIATSNAHSDLIKSELEKGKSVAEVSDLIKKRLTEYFRPELLNRFDDIIAFKDLSKDDIRKIAALQLKSIVKQAAQTRGINLSFGDDVPQKLAELGWDPVFGARPLRGVIREKIRDAIADKILRGELARGSEVRIGVADDDFILTSKGSFNL
jgi:ATP-dependent Clp protease ATP-binding subunit ClpC